MHSRRSILGASALAAAALAGCASMPWSGGDGDPGEETPTDPGTGTPSGDGVDDWQYTPPSNGPNASGGAPGNAQYAQTSSGSVGMAAGGAKDVNSFRRNVEEGYLPLPTDVSYEGLFYEYYFDTGDAGACANLFCPSYGPAVTADPVSGTTERYLTVGLNSGMRADEFERKKLNLAILLDTSGSMRSGFGEYYYDRAGNRQEVEDPDQPKIEVATEAIADLTRELRPDDRFGMVTYSDGAQVAKPLRRVGETDMEAIRGHLPEVEAGGGTNLSAGLDETTEMLGDYGTAPREYETRTVVLTDAMPNVGTTSEGGLRGKLRANAAENHHTTVVGVGVDFNTEVIDAITAVRGANYYSVRSPEQFQRRVAEEFEYMVTPLVFDLSVELEGRGFELEKVYGTTAAEESTGQVLSANTLFPSPRREGRTKGGVVLAKVRRTGDGEVTLTATWEDRAGERSSTSTAVTFPDGGPGQFAHTGVRKAVLLSRYADLIKNWAIDMRRNDGQPRGEGVTVPPDELGEWERQSVPLRVSEAYSDRFRAFADHFEAEMRAIGDDDLQRELDLLRTLAALDPRRDPTLNA